MKVILESLACNGALWRFLWQPLTRFARHMTWQRSQGELQRLRRELGRDYRVLAGPFMGMRYPKFEAVGSTLIGKLLGIYEIELSAVVEQILANPYETIVDIGCAEGYYAVGLAMRKPNSRVQAFDTDPRARELCSEMASLNGVADRVSVHGACVPEHLLAVVTGGRTLIISDCEGGELEIFNDTVVPRLASCDLLIEAHDFIVRGISETLQARFFRTHHCRLLHSIGPIEKSVRYPTPLIRETAPEVLAWLYSEGRPETMQWLHLTPRRERG